MNRQTFEQELNNETIVRVTENIHNNTYEIVVSNLDRNQFDKISLDFDEFYALRSLVNRFSELTSLVNLGTQECSNTETNTGKWLPMSNTNGSFFTKFNEQM